MDKLKILDCTLRDGGYYTNWDFDSKLVENYVVAMEKLPINYIELGYRSKSVPEYFGEYFYSPVERIKYLKSLAPTTGFAFMIDEKNTAIDELNELFLPMRGICSLVRIAVAPEKLANSIALSKHLKELGFEVAINIMYVSKIKFDGDLIALLNQGKGAIDYLYLVDSYGGISPQEITDKVKLVKEKTAFTIGFHGHNNMELALSNAIAAMEAGAEIIDSTVTGMGRGAGNLKTELFLTYLYAKRKLPVDFAYLSYILPLFEELQRKYNWGTNLPYMISGAFSLPQKDVMDWMGKRRYSINSLVQAMASYQKEQAETRFKIADELNGLIKAKGKALIVGGGNTVTQHLDRILEYLKSNPDVLVIHSSTRNVERFLKAKNPQILCLTGQEGKKLDERHFDLSGVNLIACVLPPFPRKMGAYVPAHLHGKTFELGTITFVKRYHDSPLAIAFQLLNDLGIAHAGLVGVDGYQETLQRDFELRQETQEVIDCFLNTHKGSIEALTLTTYYGIKQSSIYALP